MMISEMLDQCDGAHGNLASLSCLDNDSPVSMMTLVKIGRQTKHLSNFGRCSTFASDCHMSK